MGFKCLLFALIMVGVLMHVNVQGKRRFIRRIAPSYCHLNSEMGHCKGWFIRFAWNSALGQCEQFIYGGCAGNQNNFESKEECEQICSVRNNKTDNEILPTVIKN